MTAQNLQLETFIRTLDAWGLTQVMLPFLLIFVIVFAILQKTRILGENKKNLNVVVAMVVGLLAVVPHVTGNFAPESDPVLIINHSLPSVSIILVAVVFLLILIGVFGQDVVMLGMTAPGWIILISLVIILIIFGGAAGWWDDSFSIALERVFGEEGVAIALMLLVFGIIIAWVTSEPKADKKPLLKRMGIDLDKIFKK